MKLRNRQQVVSSGQEGAPPKPWASRITSLVYYGVITGLLLYGIFFVGNRLLNFRANGLVTTRTIPIASTRDGRVAELPFGTGDTVRAGALLATVRPGLACQASDSSRIETLRMDILLDRARLEVLGEQIDGVQARAIGLESREALELDIELRSERPRLEVDIIDLEAERHLLGLEIQLKQQALRGAVPRDPDPRCQPDLVRAPFDGTVHSVHREVYSVVNVGEPVLSLEALRPQAVVVAYADPRLLTSLFPGKAVRIEFPDGTEAIGAISAVRAASESFAQLESEEYQLVESEVLIEVIPIDPAESERWLRFQSLGVRITGRRGAR